MRKQRPRILVITDFFFPDSTGGANKMAYYTAKGLAEAGFDITVLTRAVDSICVPDERVHGMRVMRYPFAKKNPLYFLLFIRPKLKTLLSQLHRKMAKPFDLIINHQPLVAAVLKRHPAIRRSPWLYQFHSPWSEEFKIKYTDQRCLPFIKLRGISAAVATINRVEATVLRRSCKIIVLSRFMQDRVARLHALLDKTLIIPGCVDTHTFKPAADRNSIRRQLGLPVDKIILFTVRNIRQRMGLENLVRAAAGLDGLQTKVQVVIAGRGELESRLKRLVKRLKNLAPISFPGSLSEEALIKYYQASDLFVLPTEQLEGFGMVTLEALSSGLPVIATPVGATPEILTQIGQHWMCADSSAKALSATIRERVRWLQDHPEDHALLRDRCRQLACRAYDWKLITDQWVGVCNEAIGA